MGYLHIALYRDVTSRRRAVLLMSVREKEELHSGMKELFFFPVVDQMRGYFSKKPKLLRSKLTTIKEAVERIICDGSYIAIGGFGSVRIPTAVLHEIVRQRKKNLGVSGHTATHDFQILAAGGCIGRCDVAYVVGLEARGLSKVARSLFEDQGVEATEWTNATLAWRYRAAAMGVPFLPTRVMLGSDTFRYSAAKEIRCPFTDIKLAAVPALYPDVAIIHVHEADVFGNCRIKGITISDLDLARAAKNVIVTAERIVAHEEIRGMPDATVIPYFLVDAVIEVPYGSYPGNMPYEYFSDEDHLRLWLESEKSPEGLAPLLEKYIYGTDDFSQYLELCGGTKRLQELRRIELLWDRR